MKKQKIAEISSTSQASQSESSQDTSCCADLEYSPKAMFSEVWLSKDDWIMRVLHSSVDESTDALVVDVRRLDLVGRGGSLGTCPRRACLPLGVLPSLSAFWGLSAEYLSFYRFYHHTLAALEPADHSGLSPIRTGSLSLSSFK